MVWPLWIYDAVNNLSHVRAAEAVGHAARPPRSRAHPEHRHRAAPKPCHPAPTSPSPGPSSATTATPHSVVTFGALRPSRIATPYRYRGMRPALVVISLIELAVWLVYPMAPPADAARLYRHPSRPHMPSGPGTRRTYLQREPVHGHAEPPPRVSDVVLYSRAFDHPVAPAENSRRHLPLPDSLRRWRHREPPPDRFGRRGRDPLYRGRIKPPARNNVVHDQRGYP